MVNAAARDSGETASHAATFSDLENRFLESLPRSRKRCQQNITLGIITKPQGGQHGTMSAWPFRTIIILALALCAQIVHAFVGPPIILPDNPIAGQTLSVSVRSGDCDGFLSDEPAAVIRMGNTVRVVLEGVHEEGLFHCNLAVGTSVFSIGSFEAGSYTFQIDWHYVPFGGTDVTETLGTLQIVIAGAPVVPLPAVGPLAALVAALALVIAAAFRLRRGHPGLVALPRVLCRHTDRGSPARRGRCASRTFSLDAFRANYSPVIGFSPEGDR